MTLTTDAENVFVVSLLVGFELAENGGLGGIMSCQWGVQSIDTTVISEYLDHHPLLFYHHLRLCHFPPRFRRSSSCDAELVHLGLHRVSQYRPLGIGQVRHLAEQDGDLESLESRLGW